MSKLFAVREEILSTKEGRKKLENFVKQADKIPPFSVLQLDETQKQIICKVLTIKVTDDSKVSSERRQATTLSFFVIHEGELSLFFASEDVLLRHLQKLSTRHNS